jgi:hypothetical protein
LEHLSEHGVNMIAFTAFPVGGGNSQLEFFPENSAKLKAAAEDAGIDLLGPGKAFLIQGEDRVGALHDYHLKLANANINVQAANGVSSGAGRFGYMLWVAPEDVPKAADILVGDETAGHHGTLRPGGVDW